MPKATKPYVIPATKNAEDHYNIHLREDGSFLGTVGQDQRGWRAFHPDHVDYTFYSTRSEAAEVLYERFMKQHLDKMLDVNYCPDCKHPWSYHSEEGCSMPVKPGTHMPVMSIREPSAICDCKQKTYNGYLLPEATK